MADHLDAIAADVAATLDALGAEMRDVIDAKLSIPAGVRIGPRGGKHFIGSRPGENPRQRTGRLRSSVRAEVTTAGLASSLSVSAATPYAPILQNHLDRPVLSDTGEQFAETIPDRVAAVIRGPNT